MKKALILLASMAVALTTLAQTPAVQWAKSMGGKGSDVGTALAIDKDGNVYTTGTFSDTVDFDPGPEVFKLVSAGENDIFISKFDSSGSFIWAKRIGDADANYAYAIAIDSKGNVSITGDFYGNVSNAFWSKLDASGNIIFTKMIDPDPTPVGNSNPNPSSSYNSISIDNLDNVYMTGYFGGEHDFDPSDNTFKMKATGYHDGFISKFDIAGNFIWAKQFKIHNRTKSYDESVCYSLKLDSFGFIYLTGSFSGTVDFDPDIDTFNLASNSLTSMFITKLDNSGGFIWAKQIDNNSTNIARTFIAGTAITIDGLDNVYTTGSFSGIADFDPSNSTTFYLSSIGPSGYYSCVFISKLDKDGNFVWAKGIHGDPTIDYSMGGKAITVDQKGNVYTTGSFQGTFDFDPGNGTFNLTSNTGSHNESYILGDAFISKLNANGNFVWAISMGDTAFTEGASLALDNYGNIYTSGLYEGTLEIGNKKLTSSGKSDIYVLRLHDPIVLGTAEEYSINSPICLYPNPSYGVFKIIMPSTVINTRIEVYNSFGVLILSQPLVAGQNAFNIDKQPNGIFVAKTIGDGKVLFAQKIIKQ